MGGGGAACAAARNGARVLLLEAGSGVGGTSTWAGVNNWEPVAGATGLPEELYHRLRQMPDRAALQLPHLKYHPDRPWGWFKLADSDDYRLSLSRRSGVPITFEPEALDRVMRDILEETGCEVRCQTRFERVSCDNRRIESITTGMGSKIGHVEADVFIDSTAEIHLARAAGCKASIGMESRDTYGEPAAPESTEMVLNNASLCYRVTPLADGEDPWIQDCPEGICTEDLRPVTSIRTYPNGDLNMNPIHMMSGIEAHELGNDAYEAAERRILAHWHMLQTKHGFDRWRLIWTSPRLGIREGYRLVEQYVLKEQDVDGGYNRGGHSDLIAIADHSLDFHGARPSRELHRGPFGIPFRCLLTQEFDNLLVACRGASFSSVAASSCRLSRTMMVLG